MTPQDESLMNLANGKWMVVFGLGTGLVLAVLVNSSKNEPTGSTKAPVALALITAVPAYSPATAAPVTLGRHVNQKIFIQQRAATEAIHVLGQYVLFSNPRGYCTLGKSAREVVLMDWAKRSLGKGSRLLHAAVLCVELEEYRMSQREILDHWLQIQLIGPEGNFQRIEIPREAFLSGLSNRTPRLNSAELNRELTASFENSDIALSDMKFEPIGRSGNAAYFSMRMNINVGASSRLISGISAITLLNSLPLSINVYEGAGSPQSRAQLQTVHRELLNSLLTEN